VPRLAARLHVFDAFKIAGANGVSGTRCGALLPLHRAGSMPTLNSGAVRGAEMARACRALGGAGALVAVALASIGTPVNAHFDASKSADWDKVEGARPRTLCYSLADITDTNWQPWIRKSVEFWNSVSAKTGWKLVPCKEGDKPDISFVFGQASSGGAQAGWGAPGGGKFHIIIQKDMNGQWVDQRGRDESGKFKKERSAVSRVKAAGGYNGWDTKGATTLDPVLVVAHELGHALRLDHPDSPVDTGDIEDPVGLGNHDYKQPSTSDIDQAKAARDEGLAYLDPMRPTETYAVSFQGGLTAYAHGNRDFTGVDDFFGPDNLLVDGRDLGTPGTTGQLGALITAYSWGYSDNGPSLTFRWFLQSGLFATVAGTGGAAFANVSAVPRANGTAEFRDRFFVPLFVGVSFPTPIRGLWLDLFGGAYLNSSTLRINLTEAGAPLGAPTSGARNVLSLDPAVGAGLRSYLGQLRPDMPLTANTSIAVFHRGAQSLTVPSVNFPSETYTQAIGPQTGVRAMVGLGAGF
jgi:hypothetical protein